MRLPWTRGCFVCGEENQHGLRLRARLEGELVVIDYEAVAAHQGWKGILHGGITAALVDEVMTWAAIRHSRRPMVAAEISVRLRSPVAVGSGCRVEGWVEPRSRPRLARAGARILSADGEELATAAGKYMPAPQQDARVVAQDFVSPPGVAELEELLGGE